MRTQLLSSLLAFGLVSILSCNSNSGLYPLVGSWQAFAVKEEGRELSVNIEEIRLRFEENGIYQFESTLNTREAGHFQYRKGKLITTDTLSAGAQPKTVEVAKLVSDTLVLRMHDDGKDRTLSLRRDL